MSQETDNIIYRDPIGINVMGLDVLDLNRQQVDRCYRVELVNGPLKIEFQHGSPNEYGRNGLTNETLLAILIDRTKNLHANTPCPENDIAIAHLEGALAAFEERSARCSAT